jgi:NAD(P)-dependent dehydrogenase (short-subunit alcohol dehydrogenase family)
VDVILKKGGKNVAGGVKSLVKMRLKGKVAIITGGSSGIGKSTALLFAKEGATVVIATRESKAGNNVVDEIKRKKGKAIFVKTDVSKEIEVKNLIEETILKFKKIDIMFNNAGIELAKPVIETREDELDNVLGVNLKGVFFGCKHVIPYMIKNKGGSIINTASIAGIVGFPNLAAYCASKAGVVLLAKEIALDYAKQGIRANAICPGAIDTQMTKRFLKKSPDPKKDRKDLENLHPIGRLGKPEEIANCALFLASDDSSFVTGTTIIADGGITAQ